MAIKKKATPKKKTGAPKKKPVRKKTSSNRLKRHRKTKTPLILNEFKKILVGVLILISVCLSIAMIADILIRPGSKPEDSVAQKSKKESVVSEQKEPSPVQSKVKKSTSGLKEKSKTPDPDPVAEKKIKYEVFENVEPTIIEKTTPQVKDKVPRIAIIIDDIGYDRKMTMALFDLDANITFSILPFSPFGKQLANRLNTKGAQLMLHLPMEPVQFPEANPGPGAILSSMTPDELLNQLKKDIQDIPHIVGMNNHMGSKLTGSSVQMNQIFTILKKENLFFVDSRTAPKSQCKASARLFKLKFAQRDVFLDNQQDGAYIRGQFNELIAIAKRHGSAIGIGHPYKATLEALSVLIPEHKEQVKIVRVDELTYIP